MQCTTHIHPAANLWSAVSYSASDMWLQALLLYVHYKLYPTMPVKYSCQGTGYGNTDYQYIIYYRHMCHFPYLIDSDMPDMLPGYPETAPAPDHWK